jgi:hypothetical protein
VARAGRYAEVHPKSDDRDDPSPLKVKEVLLYRPMFRMRTGGDPAESSILFSFEIDFAGG